MIETSAEGPMIREWWAGPAASISGRLCFEWPLVPKAGPVEQRRVDALVVTGGDCHEIVDRSRITTITDRDVIVVQAKAKALSMPVAGQALGSRFLAERHGPRSVRPVLLCGADDSDLRPLVEARDVEVVVLDQHPGGAHNRPADLARIRLWHDTVGGTLVVRPILGGAPRKRAHAVHLDTPQQIETDVLPSLAGRNVTVLAARPAREAPAYDMSMVGTALFSAELLAGAGAASIRPLVLTQRVDPLIEAYARSVGVDSQVLAAP